MIFGNTDKEQHRLKLGLAFLVVGVLLMLWAWGSWIYRTTTKAGVSSVVVDAGHEDPEQTARAVRAAPSVLLGVALVVLTFLVASYAFVRASRRYRARLSRRTAPPTEVADIWAMHKLKSFDDSDA